MEQQVNGFGARYGGAQGSSNPNSLQFYTLSKLRQEDGDDRTASVLGGFSGTTGNNVAFKGVNSYSNYNYHASDVGIGDTSNMPSSSFPGGDTCVTGPKVIPSSQHPGFGSSASAGSNIPRKSPFDIGEPGGQFAGGRNDSGPGNPGTPGYPGGSFGGGVPLGPMSVSGPQSWCEGLVILEFDGPHQAFEPESAVVNWAVWPILHSRGLQRRPPAGGQRGGPRRHPQRAASAGGARNRPGKHCEIPQVRDALQKHQGLSRDQGRRSEPPD
ncbi:Yip1p like integral membrane protein [Cryptosporidium canis]|uniref:Yip1p like integral membrane protein n=1 Tax=Cryptosporidium canis TaxID=195482 RepID=A0A9D5DHZ2_9CRYT|nr:Yip1p like integral membrane protein [Cryptosporidium canis]